MINIAFAVFKKEIVDALRDRKTLLAVLISSVLIGPIVLVLISVQKNSWILSVVIPA